MARAVRLERGALTISIDLEMLWGVWDNRPSPMDAACSSLERVIAEKLLALFGKYDVRVTWAIVGRLLDAERGFDGLRAGPGAWYAPDIVDRIRSSRVEHEIGSHSYGHVYFSAIDRAAALDDLLRARRVHLDAGLPFRSFVFPRNMVGHLDALKEVGLRVWRSSDAGLLRWAEERAPSLRPLLNVAEKAAAAPSPLVDAIAHDDGLVELPSSMLLMARGGLRRLVRRGALAFKLRSGVRRAAKERRVFHLWFHPSNFYVDMDGQIAVLETCLLEARSLRDRGVLDVRTMGDFDLGRTNEMPS